MFPCAPPDVTPYDRRSYLHLLGMLNYLLRSRPDISTALAFASTKSVNPTRSDYQALLDVVYYLWGSKDLGLKLHPGDQDAPISLHCYVDASYLTHPDGRGHSGYCITLGTLGTFYAKSVKQPLVATRGDQGSLPADH